MANLNGISFSADEQLRFDLLLDEQEMQFFCGQNVESVKIVELERWDRSQEESVLEKDFSEVNFSEFPHPSAGLIGRKTSDSSQSSSKTRNDGALKLPRVEDKTGTINYIKGFVLAKCQVYWQFSAGGRYNKLAYRILISNETFDKLDLQGLQQYMYLSSTGSNVAHMSVMKLGATYQFYSLKWYKISDTIKIANWKQGAYVNEIPELKPESDEFRSVENFGTGGAVAGTIMDICISSFCNCASLIGPSNSDAGFITPCVKCKSSGLMLIEDGEEKMMDGGTGLLTIVNIISDEGEVPVQLLIHPNFTTSKLNDLMLEVGATLEVVGSRMLNSRNLMVAFEVLSFKGAKSAKEVTENKEENEKEKFEEEKSPELKAEI